MTKRLITQRDGDEKKGAVESESPEDKPSTNDRDILAYQLPHRNTNEWMEGEDSDFPEPGLNPEHSGQRS